VLWVVHDGALALHAYCTSKYQFSRPKENINQINVFFLSFFALLKKGSFAELVVTWIQESLMGKRQREAQANGERAIVIGGRVTPTSDSRNRHARALWGECIHCLPYTSHSLVVCEIALYER